MVLSELGLDKAEQTVRVRRICFGASLPGVGVQNIENKEVVVRDKLSRG